MKKNLFFRLLVLVLAAAMTLSLTACGGADEESAQRIAELEQENEELRQQVEELTAQLEKMGSRVELAAWTLDAAPWSDGNGATVSFTATPVEYIEGQSAALSIRMGELEAEGATCSWNGTAFEGTVELSAADGYGYYCVLTNPDGTSEEVALATPENGQKEELVQLGTHLTAYANLIVDSWTASEGALKLDSGFVQVQTPRLTVAQTTVTLSSADLVFRLNGEELSRQALTLPEGEGEGSYELALTDISFALPAMEEDAQLDLWLEVSLSSGQAVSVAGGSWYYNGGELLMVVG